MKTQPVLSSHSRSCLGGLIRVGGVFHRAVTGGLVAAYLCVHVAGGHAAENNYWADRRRARGQGSLAMVNSKMAPGAENLFRAMPKAGPLSLKTDPALLAGAASTPTPDGSPRADWGWLTEAVLPHGTVRETYMAPGGTSPLVVHVQDAHDVESAQRNIGAIVDGLRRKKGATLVGLEGARGPVDLSLYRTTRRSDLQIAVADILLRRGYIGGVEHRGLTGDAPALWGIEDTAPYRANIEALEASRRSRPEAESHRAEWGRAAERLKEKIYGPAMREFDRHRENYQSHREGLDVYVPFLLSTLPTGAPLRPNLLLLRDALKAEAGLDFKSAETERMKLIEALAGRLNPSEMESLLRDSLALKTDRLTFKEYQQKLSALCQKHGVVWGGGALTSYLAYVDLVERIDKNELLNELQGLEMEAPTRLAVRPEERLLAEVSRRLALLRKLIANEMSPADWKQYSAEREEVMGVARVLKSLGAPISGELNSDLILPFENFCAAALRRNEGMLANLLAKARAEKAKTAVLVAGGFHTDDLTGQMRRAGISYVVVSPKITSIPDTPSALAAFVRDPLPLEKLLAGEKVGVNYPRLVAGNELVAVVPGADIRRETAEVIASGITAVIDPGSLFPGRATVATSARKDQGVVTREIAVNIASGRTVRLLGGMTEGDGLSSDVRPDDVLLRESVLLAEGPRTVFLSTLRTRFSMLLGGWAWLKGKFQPTPELKPVVTPSTARADSFMGEWPPRVDPRAVPVIDAVRPSMSEVMIRLLGTLSRLESSPPDFSGVPNAEEERKAYGELVSAMQAALKDFSDGRDVYGSYDAWALERDHPGYLNHGVGLPWESVPERKPRLLLLDQRFFDGRSILNKHAEEAAFHELGHAAGLSFEESAHLRLLRWQAVLFWGLSPRDAHGLDQSELEKHPQNKLGRALRQDRMARLLLGADKVGGLHNAIRDRVEQPETLVRWFEELNAVILQLSRQERRPFESIVGPLIQAIEQLPPQPTLEFYRAVRERAAAAADFAALPLTDFVLRVAENQNNEVRDLVAIVLRRLEDLTPGMDPPLRSAVDRLSQVANSLETTATFNSEEVFWKTGTRTEADYSPENRRLALAEDFLMESRAYVINDQISETLRSSLWGHREEQVLKTLAESAGLDADTIYRLRAIAFWGMAPEEAGKMTAARLSSQAGNLLDRAVRVWSLAWWLREDVGVYEIRQRLRDYLRRGDDAGLIGFLQEMDDATKIDLPIGNGTWMRKQAALSDAIRRARGDRRPPERDEALTEVVFRATAMSRTMPVEAAYPLMKAVALLNVEEEEALVRAIENNHKNHPGSYRTHGLLLAPLLMAGRIPETYVEDMDFAFDEVVEVSPEGFRLWGGGLGPVESFILLAYARLAYARLVSAAQRLRESVFGSKPRSFSVVGVEPDYVYKRGPDGGLVRLSDDALSQKLDFTGSETHYIRVPAPILTRESEFGHVEGWALKSVLVRVRSAKNEAGGTVLLWRDLWSPQGESDSLDESRPDFNPDQLETRFAKTLYAYRSPGQNANDDVAKKSLFNPETEWSFSAFHGALATVLLADREMKRRAAMGPRWVPSPLILNDAQSSLVALLVKRPDGFRTELTDALDKGPYGEMLRLLRLYMVVAMKTHTYANRQYFDVYEPGGRDSEWGKRMAMFLVGMRDEGDFPRLKKIHLRRRPIKDGALAFFDLTSSALRAATLQLSVAANHAANVWRMYGDRVVGMTNGSNFESVLSSFKSLFRGGDPLRPRAAEMRDYKKNVKTRFFETLLEGDTLPSAYREELRSFFQTDGTWNDGVFRPVVGHVGRLVQVKFGKILSSVNDPNVADPSKDRAWTEENIRAWLKDGANVVILGKVQANPESPKMRDWLLDLQRRISEEWRNGTEDWDRTKHGRLIFLPAATTQVQELLADSIDAFIFDSEENTEAAGFTEAGRGKSIYVVPPNPKGEGLFDNQGLSGRDGNYLKPEDTSPAAYRRVVSDLLSTYWENPEAFAARLANSWRLYRITNVFWTAHANLSVLNAPAVALEGRRRADAAQPRRVFSVGRNWIAAGATAKDPLRIAVEMSREGRGEDLRVLLKYSPVGGANSAGHREWLDVKRLEMPLVDDGPGRKEYALDLKTLGLNPGDYEFTVLALRRNMDSDENAAVQLEGVRFGVNGKFSVPSPAGSSVASSPAAIGALLGVWLVPGAAAFFVLVAVAAMYPGPTWGFLVRARKTLRSLIPLIPKRTKFGGPVTGEVAPPPWTPRQTLAVNFLGGKVRRLEVGAFEISAALLREEVMREAREAEDERVPFESFLAVKAGRLTVVPKEMARSLMGVLAIEHRAGRASPGAAGDQRGVAERQINDALFYLARLSRRLSDADAEGVLKMGAEAYNQTMGLEIFDEGGLQSALDNGRWIGLQLTENVIRGTLETEEDRRVDARLRSLARLMGEDRSRAARVTLLAPDTFKGTDVTGRLAAVAGRKNLSGLAVVFENDIVLGEEGGAGGLLSAQRFVLAAQKRSLPASLDPMDLLVLDPARWRVEDSVKGLAKLLVLLTGDLVFNATEGIGEDVRYLQYVRINA